MKRKAYTPKKYVSRKRRKTTATTKKLVRNVMYKQVETKSGYFLPSANLVKEQIISWNLMGACAFTNGTGADNGTYVGDSFRLVGVRIRLGFTNNTAINNEPVRVTVALVRAYKYTVALSLAAADLFPGYSLVGYPPRFDNSKCQVLMRKEVVLKTIITGVRDYKSMFTYKKLDKLIKFDANVGTYGIKGMQYYLVMYPGNWSATSGTSAVASVGGVVECLYKDM